MKALSLITAARLDNHDGGYIPGIRSYFKLMDLHAGHYWSTVDYMRWIDIHQSAFHERLKQRDERPASFYPAFYRWLNDRYYGDCYIIYTPSSDQYRAPLSALKKWGLAVDDRMYHPSWGGPLRPGAKVETAAQYARYQQNVLPGDVIVLRQGHKRTAWFLDNSGWVKLKGFDRSRWGDNEPPVEDEPDEPVMENKQNKEENCNVKCG